MYKIFIENYKYVKVYCVKMYIKCLFKVVKLMFNELKGNMIGWMFEFFLYFKILIVINWIFFN